jgi:diguanylate cyclase (GGDEF)-like protein
MDTQKDSVSDVGAETRPTVAKRPIAKPSRTAYLVHIYPHGPNLGKRYALTDAILLLGRAEECNVSIPDDAVSRHHARIDPSSGGYCVTDLHSKNGIYVNDQKTTEARLRDGDYLRIGNCVYRFLTGENVEAEYHKEIYDRSIIDVLTDVPNRRFLQEFLERKLAESSRLGQPLGLVLFDIDRFKAINDDLGHLGGDFTLRELATCLKEHVRSQDLLARYGGEEFALVMVGASHQEAVEKAERIRQEVGEHPFVYEGKRYRLTISLGIASVSGQDNPPVAELIRQADDKLYQAKRTGRNCVVA